MAISWKNAICQTGGKIGACKSKGASTDDRVEGEYDRVEGEVQSLSVLVVLGNGAEALLKLPSHPQVVDCLLTKEIPLIPLQSNCKDGFIPLVSTGKSSNSQAKRNGLILNTLEFGLWEEDTSLKGVGVLGIFFPTSLT